MDNNYSDWRKASYSNGSGQCVETASSAGTVAARDSADQHGTVITFTADAWRGLLADVRANRAVFESIGQ